MPFGHALGLLVFVGGIILIAAFAKRIKNAPPRPATDADEVAALHEQLARMDERMAVLERILDAEAPGWRNRL